MPASVLRRLLGSAATAIAAGAALLGSAPPASADTALEVTTPAEGRYQPGTVTPLLVTVRADRAVTGSLQASFDGRTTGRQRVEVPGGSTKQVVVLVATPPYNAPGQLTFTADDGKEERSVRLNLTGSGPDELVAVLPALTQSRQVPATAKLAVDVGVARLFRFDPSLLAAGGEVLSPFSQLVATPADLGQLSAEQLDGVRLWLARSGGTLVVDAEPGAGLPAQLAPTADATTNDDPAGAAVGLGRVRWSRGRAGAGAWDGLLAPTASRTIEEMQVFNRTGFAFGGFASGENLATDAGVRVLAIGSLLGLLGVYTLVAGPLLWVVLRRSRRETALWVTLPALALVATVAVYGFGRALRSSASAAHASVVADLPGARVRWTEVLVSAPNGGRDGVRLEAGWHPAPATVGPDSRLSETAQRTEGANLITDIPPGGAGLVTAEQTGPAAPPSWSFSLSAKGDDLTGSITNRTDHRLESITVTAGRGFASVPALDPGASAPITLLGASRASLGEDELVNRLMGGFGPFPSDNGSANPAALVSWLSSRPGLRDPGVVMAVGWTRQPTGPLATLRSGPVNHGRTAFVSATTAPVDPAGSGRVEVLRGGSTQVTDVPPPGDACGGAKGLVATARLTSPGPSPGGAAGRSLVLDVDPTSVTAYDLWDGTAWRPGGLAKAPGQGQVTVAVPPSAVTGSGVYLRLQLGCRVFDQADPFPRLRTAVPGERVAPLGQPAGPATVIGPDGTARG